MLKQTILFLASNPGRTTLFTLDREARSIQEELERSGHRDRFEFATRWAVAPMDLLREVRKLKPTVVHFSGHGDTTGLMFQAEDGQPQLVSTEALAKVFEAVGLSVKLVVLNACYTESQANAICAHVDCVVGMSGSIEGTAARIFSIGFYGGLGEGESIDSAYRQGLAAIAVEGFADNDPPTLKVRDGIDATRLILATSDAARPSTLDVRVQRTRYVSYIYLKPATSPVPTEVPVWSWVHTERGLLAGGAKPEDVGLQPASYGDGPPPHLPDSELFIDVTLVGRGPTAVISSIDLEIEQRWELPPGTAIGSFLPLLEPIIDTAVLTSRQHRYPLFGDRSLALKNGEIDLLRVDVLIANEEGPGIYAFRIVITYTDGEEQRARTPLLYLAKGYHGSTRRIPVDKRPQASTAAVSNLRGAGRRATDRDDLWMDPSYPDLLRFNKCQDVHSANDLQYLVDSFRSAVMGGTRDELQRIGFQSTPWRDEAKNQPAILQGLVPTYPDHGLDYRRTLVDEMMVYKHRNTRAYDCLFEACRRLARSSTTEQQSAVDYLAQQLWHEQPEHGLDVAGVLDTLTLLSLFRSRQAYDVLVNFLSTEHSVVLQRTVSIFTVVRYRPAARALLAIFEQRMEYATGTALTALGLNGEPESFDAIVEACIGHVECGLTDVSSLKLAAATLVDLDMDQAHIFARSSLGDTNESRRLLAFQILERIRQHSPGT